MPKKPVHPDVLVLGSHPAAYLAAALLAEKKVRTAHATLPDEPVIDRLVIVNPKLFALHKALGPLERKVNASSMFGLRFLSNQPDTASEYKSKAAVIDVAWYSTVQGALSKLAEGVGVEMHRPDSFDVHHVDERGAEVSLGSKRINPKALIVAGSLPEHLRRMLAVPDDFGDEVMSRRSFTSLPASQVVEPGTRPVLPMSLDLDGQLCWGWLLQHDGEVQLTVQQPLHGRQPVPPEQLLNEWGQVLHRHGLLKAPPAFSAADVRSVDVPLAGALAHEGVGNRTLVIGPAGGFYSACGEDIYPNCWSAVYAADVMRKALKEPHLQDALNSYREVWRTTLGDYLRGPQQNLRFLLPLVYRNEVMTARLAESILLGRSVVR